MLDRFLPPVPSLAWDICGTDDRLVRIDKKESENLAMTRFVRVDKAKWLFAMLKDLQRCQQVYQFEFGYHCVAMDSIMGDTH